MPKSSAAPKDPKVPASLSEWSERFLRECDERIARQKELLYKDGGISLQLFKCFEQQCENLPPGLAEMKLSDYMAYLPKEDEQEPETPMLGRGGSRANKGDCGTVQAGGHNLRNTRARAASGLDSTILRPPANTMPLGTTLKRPPKSRHHLVANTPMGPMRLPPMITPKIKDGGNVQCRTMKPEEVAFSVTGTPVLAAAPVNDDAEQIAQMLLLDEAQLTPETRGVVQGLKTVIRRMHNDA